MSTLSAENEQSIYHVNSLLALAVLLMPWKRTTTDVTVDDVTTSSHGWWSLFEMEGIEKWKVGMAGGQPVYDDNLPGRVDYFLWITATLVVGTVGATFMSIYWDGKTKIRALVDVLNIIVTTTLLILAFTFQDDFDAYWKKIADGDPEGTVTDYDEVFISIGPLFAVLALGLVSATINLNKWKSEL